jgi:hypothetical protein
VTVACGTGDCRSERTPSARLRQWAPTIAFVLFVIGFWATVVYLGSVAAAEQLNDVVQFELWVGLFGAMGGFALGAVIYFVLWLSGILRLFNQVRVGSTLSWFAVVAVILTTVFASLFIGADSAENSLDRDLAIQARPIIVLVAICLLPGLVAFVALRSVATGETNWRERGSCRLRLVMRLRTELLRMLGTFGAFLTLLVITTGMRRRALLAFDPELPVPAEGVLLYGLLFAVMLGLFYGITTAAIDNRALRLLEEFAPLPDPSDPALSEQVRRRNDLAGVIGSGGSWRSFETRVVIAAPLLTALIGNAIGA